MIGSNLALDTNAYSDWQRGIRWQKIVSRARLVFVPFVVIAELRAGFAAGSKSRENSRNLDAFLSSSSVSILYPDDTTLTLYGKLFAELRRQGTPIPSNDLWIAALCTQHNLPLATSDDHFSYVTLLIRAE
ncbi:MAG: type II toxin-antitoxin system VapC family toxin [Verrucomicrobiales bacterium]|nr:type II toxin-antitoxin system VapC family toxin [Verrucomicrobiales bacterium]